MRGAVEEFLAIDRQQQLAPGGQEVAVAAQPADVAAVEADDELLDFGGGEGSYKERLTDEDRPVMWCTSYRRGPRYPLARLRRLPGQAARR